MRSWNPTLREGREAWATPRKSLGRFVLGFIHLLCPPERARIHGRPNPPTPFEELSSSSWQDSRKFPSGSCDSRLVWGPSTARLLRIREAVASLRMTRGGVDQRNLQKDGAVESHASQRKRSTGQTRGSRPAELRTESEPSVARHGRPRTAVPTWSKSPQLPHIQ
jgi:hypothetical protein